MITLNSTWLSYMDGGSFVYSRNQLFKRFVLIACALLLVGIPYVPGTQAEEADRLVSSRPISIGIGGVTDYQPTSDGGYVAAMGTSVMKVDDSGNIQWTATVPGNDVQFQAVCETADGGYLYAGSKDNKFMYGTFNSTGQQTSAIHSLEEGAAYAIAKVDDGFVITGHVRSVEDVNPYVARTDRNGRFMAFKAISLPGDQFIYDVLPAGGTDQDVILVGSTGGNQSQRGYITKVNSSIDKLGTVIWEESYGEDDGSYNTSLISADYAQDASGQPGYVVTGTEVSGSGDQKALLLFTALDGNQKWLRTYPVSARLGLSVVQTKDGGFTIAGGDNVSTGFLYKTDVNGNPQWQKEWPDTGNLRKVLQLANGTYQLAGGMLIGLTFQVWVGPPNGITTDDEANRIIGLDETMEYSMDGGNRYETYVTGQEPVFDGDVSVLVRYKADPAKGYEVGEPKTFTFTANPGNPGNPGLPPGHSYNQDGLGFSGTIKTQPLGDQIVMTSENHWPGDFSKKDAAFAGGVFDGKNIWMVPHSADRVIKLDPKTGQMTDYNDWPSGFQPESNNLSFNGSFRGGVYDGNNIWMIPYSADRVVRLDKNTGEMSGYKNWPAGFTKPIMAFSGGVDDGNNIWLIPYNADRIVKLDKSTGNMTGYNNWPAGFSKSSSAFSGGVYDGRNIWMIPLQADRVIKLDTVTEEMMSYNRWPDGFTKNWETTFFGGTYDGENIWMIPYGSDQAIKLNASTGEMTGYPVGTSRGASAFASGIYDGKSIWMIPYHSGRVIRIDKATGEMTGYNNWPHDFSKGPMAFFSSVYDGESIWMIPYSADRVVKLSTAPSTYSLTYDGNGATGGSVPADSGQYGAGASVTVLGNTGSLEKSGYTFAGWNTAADGSGTDYAPDASYIIAGNATLYAKWTKKSSNADLRSLTISSGVLDPAFTPDMRRYAANVAHGISTVTVTAETADNNATATVSVSDSTGTLVSGPLPLINGTASDPLPIGVGVNTLTVKVTAPDDATTQTYTVTVTRKQPNKPTPPTYPQYYPVTDINLDESKLTFKIGDAPIRLNATILPSYATNRQVTWSSSDPQVASVDQDGTVTPKAPGTAVIMVTTVDGNKTASSSITVNEKEKPYKLETSEKEILLKPNQTVPFKVFAVYSDGKREEITSSPDTAYSRSSSFLTVKPGRIKAGKKEGDATVTITFQGQEQKIEVIVTKTSVRSLFVDPKKLELGQRKTKQLKLTARLTDKKSKDVTERAVWTSSNQKVVKVSDTGEVTAVGVGSASIRAIYGGKRLNLQVTVTPAEPELSRLVANRRVVRILEGERKQVILTALYDDGSKKDVTADAKWTFSTSKIAEVTNGMITGIKAGKTTITATYQNRKITVTVYVQPTEAST